MKLPDYISRTTPDLTRREGVSPESTGLPVARGLSDLARAQSAIELDAEKKVGDAQRLGEYVARKDKLALKLSDLDVALSQDPDHTTYFERAKKGVEEASQEALSGVTDPTLKQELTLQVSGIRQRYLTNAKHTAWALSVDHSRGILSESIDQNVKAAVESTDSSDLTRSLGNIDAAVSGAVHSGIWSQEEGTKIGHDARARIYTTLAEKMADQDPARFLENYKQGLYQEHIDPLRLEQIRRYAESKNKGSEAIAAANEIWNTMGPAAASGGWGTRADGSPKGPGFLGVLKRPDGKISTELSIGVKIGGKETEIPTLVPSLTRKEIDYLLAGNKPTDTIVKKASDHARQRIAQGKSPFAGWNETPAGQGRMNPDEIPVNTDRMVSALEARFSSDPEKAAAAVSALNTLVTAHNRGVQERRDSNLSAIWKASLGGSGLADIMKMPEYAALDGASQLSVKEHLQDRSWTMSRRNEEDPSILAARHELYWRYSHPEVLSQTSESTITALYPKLGVELTDALMKQKRGLENPKKMAEAKIDQDDFNHFARQAGIAPEETKNKPILGEIKYEVENAIDAAQSATGKPLSRQEKAKLMMRGLTEFDVRARRSFLGLDLGAATMKKRLFDIQYPGNIIVPPDAREKISADLRANNLPATDENILYLYIQSQVK